MEDITEGRVRSEDQEHVSAGGRLGIKSRSGYRVGPMSGLEIGDQSWCYEVVTQWH